MRLRPAIPLTLLAVLCGILSGTALAGYGTGGGGGGNPPQPPPTQTPTSYQISVTKAGSGSGAVTSSPGGIDCGATCSASFQTGTSVTLTAVAASGSGFSGWSGCSSSGSSCTLTVGMSAAVVTATFDPVASPTSPADTSVQGKVVGVESILTSSGKRVVRAELSLDEQLDVTLTLLRSGTTLVTKHVASLQPGDRTLALKVPGSVAKGRASLRVTLEDDAGNTTMVTRSTRIKAA